MKRPLISAATSLLLAASTSAFAAKEPCIPFEPGKKLGPIALGASQADLDATKLKTKPGFTQGVLEVGPYTVWIDPAGKVETVALGLAKGVRCLTVAGKELPAASGPEAIAVAVAGCGPIDIRIGGNVIDCPSGAFIAQHLGGVEVRATKPADPKQDRCEGYATPGVSIAGPKGAKIVAGKTPVSLEVESGKKYCLPGRAVGTDLAPEEVTKKLGFDTCRTTTAIGATTVRCPYHGVQFVFAGPNNALHKIETFKSIPPHTPDN